MQLDIAVLADMANMDAAGKFNIIGEFTAIAAQELPTQPMNIVLAVRIVAAASEGSAHKLAIVLVDADGHELGRISEQPVEFGRVAPGTSGDLRMQFVVPVSGVIFPAHSTYSFQVLVDGRCIGERTCWVTAPPLRSGLIPPA